MKIYRVSNAARGEVFEVVWYYVGTRYRKSFRDEKKALTRAKEIAQALRNGQVSSLGLTNLEVESFRYAKQILAKLLHPPPLHVAVEEYVEAKKLIGDVPLVRAVEQFVADSKART